MIAFFARLVLGGLVKVGVSEGAAGAFVASRVFAPLLFVAIGALAYPAAKLVLFLHDRHVATAARVKCEAENVAAALAVENGALKRASAEKDDLINDRNASIASNERAIAELREKNRALRETAPGDGALVFADDDPWLLAAGAAGEQADRPAQRPRRR